METLRKPFQGVWNIVRFNWHFYVLSIGLVIALWAFPFLGTSIHPIYTVIPAVAILAVNLISLLISTYVYDFSNLYSLQWIDKLSLDKPNTIVNINAGFDETSSLLAQKYTEAELTVLDFYHPKKHTEISIKRARKAYPPYPGTITTETDSIVIQDSSIGLICAILSAHEIRNERERIQFFKELKRILKPRGQIFVTEHLRDFPNFLAYTIGFFHFHSKRTWLKTFKSSGLQIRKEIKTTPFISTFILEHGITS